MQRMTGIARDDTGRPANGAQVSIYNTNTTTLANLFTPSASSDTPTTALNNPIITGSDGLYSFAVADGDYDMVISGANITTQNYPRINFFDSTTAGIPGTAISSVGLSMPGTEFVVSGSPLVAPGTLSVTKNTIAANLVAAGPTTGSAAAWTFRSLVAADINAVAVDLSTAQTASGNKIWSGTQTFNAAATFSAAVSMTSTLAVTGTATFSGNALLAQVGRFTAYNNASPAAGDLWLNSTTKGFSYYNTTTQHDLSSSLIRQTSAVTVASSSAETTLLASAYTIQANWLTAGKMIQIRAKGVIGNTGTPTLRIRAKLGGATVYDTTAVTMSSITGSMDFDIVIDLVIRTTGATGTAIGAGGAFYQTANNTAPLKIAAPGTSTTTIDTTGNSSFDLTLQWGASSSSNTATITTLSVEALG